MIDLILNRIKELELTIMQTEAKKQLYGQTSKTASLDRLIYSAKSLRKYNLEMLKVLKGERN